MLSMSFYDVDNEQRQSNQNENKLNQINLFELGNVRSVCPISRAKGSCIKRASIQDRIGI